MTEKKIDFKVDYSKLNIISEHNTKNRAIRWCFRCRTADASFRRSSSTVSTSA